MIVPDVNLLLYAEMGAYAESPVARSWWEGLLNGDRQVGIPAVSLFGFLRISTNRRVFVEPLAVEDAIRRTQAWLARPQVTFLAPGPRHLEIAFDLLRGLGTAANLTSDVQIAALAIENEGEVHSNDSDFGRFAALRWRNPLRSHGAPR